MVDYLLVSGFNYSRYCMVGTDEYQVVGATKTEEMEARYTDCHTHGSDT
jgi:zinc transporter 1/2/3